MFNPDDSYATIRDYVIKLKTAIDQQAKFTWFKTKLVPKSRIDNILCCIEGSFPEEYKQAIRMQGTIGLGGYKNYQKLVGCLRKKAFLSSDCYSVVYQEAYQHMNAFLYGLKFDLKKAAESSSNMF